MKKHIIIITLLVFVSFTKAWSQSPYADSLQQIINLGKHDEGERIAYSLLSTFYATSNPGKAKILLTQLVRLSNEANDHIRLSSANSLLLSIYHNAGNLDSAAHYINILIQLMEKVPNEIKVQVNCNQAIGLYYKKRGDFKSALPYALVAITLAEKSTPDKAYIGGQWLNAGNVYQGLADYKSAMDCNIKALGNFEAAGNKKGQSFCYNNMASLYNLLKQYPNALKLSQKSYDIKKQLNDNKGMCIALEGIGQANMHLNHMPEAILNYEEALKISLEEKLPIEEMNCYFNMAKIFSTQAKDSLAIVYFKKSKTLAVQLENQSHAANVDVELAALYKNANQLKNTEQTLFTSLETFKETGNLENESNNYKQLADFYKTNKEYEKALAFSNKYHAIKDSVTGVNIQVQLRKLEEQYNSEKKEKEITLLKTDQELQQQRLFRQRILFGAAAILLILALLAIVLLVNRNRMRQRMKELELRNQIAADLHDEVGSSLSSIQLLSQMATMQGSGDQKNILEKMNNNARETMDKMSDIVWMIKPGESEAESLKQRMEHFAKEICDSKNIQLSMDLSAIDAAKLSMAQRKNIYLIFKEALNNAVKYSGTEKVEVKTIVHNRQLELTVKDFGKGFEQPVKARGNGLDNMKNRAKESGGTLMIDSTKGTAINLSVQL